MAGTETSKIVEKDEDIQIVAKNRKRDIQLLVMIATSKIREDRKWDIEDLENDHSVLNCGDGPQTGHPSPGKRPRRDIKIVGQFNYINCQ